VRPAPPRGRAPGPLHVAFRRTTPTGHVASSAYDSDGLSSRLTAGARQAYFAHGAAGRVPARAFGDATAPASAWDEAARRAGQHVTAGARAVTSASTPTAPTGTRSPSRTGCPTPAPSICGARLESAGQRAGVTGSRGAHAGLGRQSTTIVSAVDFEVRQDSKARRWARTWLWRAAVMSCVRPGRAADIQIRRPLSSRQ
jgi:hypothetical protein